MDAYHVLNQVRVTIIYNRRVSSRPYGHVLGSNAEYARILFKKNSKRDLKS